MKSYSQLQQDLTLANQKLDKMTSTVKQLGTKLKDANQERAWSEMEADHFRRSYIKLDNKISSLVLSVDECHERAISLNGFMPSPLKA